MDARGLGLLELVHRLGAAEVELLLAVKLRDDVVVVGVKPLGHLHRRRVLGAAGHGEVGVQVDRPAGVAEARRHRAQHGGRVQHLIVEREVVRRDHRKTGVRLLAPDLPAQFAGGLAQPGGVALARPVGLGGFLQLAVTPDTRKAKVRRTDHAAPPVGLSVVGSALRDMPSGRRRRPPPGCARRGSGDAPTFTPRNARLSEINAPRVGTGGHRPMTGTATGIGGRGPRGRRVAAAISRRRSAAGRSCSARRRRTGNPTCAAARPYPRRRPRG